MRLRNQPGCPCCGGSPGPGPGYPTGCVCVGTPLTVNLTSSGPCFDNFPPHSLTYGDHSTAYPGTAPAYLSNVVFPATAFGGPYQYWLECGASAFWYLRVTDVTAGTVGATLFAWSIGTGGSTCIPFHLGAGTIFPGGSPSCLVNVDG